MLRDISVREYMATNLVTFTPETEVFEAIRQLLKHKITGAPVLDEDGRLKGTFSEGDCLHVVLDAAYHEEMAGKVGEYMNTDVETVAPDTSVIEVAERFQKSKLRHFLVMDDDRLVGLISRVDILRALVKIY
ncbi:MAG: CBS domain-containing protein [Methylohalobius sp. ZOD2]